MKTLILLFALFIAVTTTAQTRISLSQDVKLALAGDHLGNNPYTPNLTFRFSQFIAKDEYFKFLAYAEYEWAELSVDYNRIGTGFGINLHNLIKNIELQAMYGINRIIRNNEYFASWDLTGQISYNLSPTVGIFAELQQTKRNDLKKQPFRYSGKLGIRLNLNQIFSKN